MMNDVQAWGQKRAMAPVYVALIFAVLIVVFASQASASEFKSIFNGRTLDGWTGDPAYFEARNGTLIAGSDKEIPLNTFLILEKPYADFHLRYKYRWATEGGNSGIQFRSGIAEGHFAMAGMQANLTPVTPKWERFAMLYEELGDRAEMVLLGQKAEITRRAAGRGGQGRVVRTVVGTTNSREDIIKSIRPYPEWNHVELIVHGQRVVHVINELIVFDATDKDPLGRTDGLLGIQVHAGSPMTLEMKDIEIKEISSIGDLSKFTTNPGPAPIPSQTYKDSTKVAMPDQPLP